MTRGLGLLLLLAGPALGQPSFGEPRVEREGALVRIAVEVQGAALEPGLALALDRGDLRGELTARPEGGLLGTLATTRLLVPGRWELLLTRGQEVLARRELVLGTDEERRASEARERRWLEEQARVARTLAVSLERTGQLQRGLAFPKAEQAMARFGPYLTRWRVMLRQARGELALFERRLVAPHLPAAVLALRTLHGTLTERGRAWEAAIAQGAAPPSEEALVAAGAALAAAGLPGPGQEAWRAGPLGQVPAWREVRPGQPWESDGFRLAIPAGFGPGVPPPVPEGIRLLLGSRERKGIMISVTVSEDPELRELAALEAMHATFNWETHPGFARPVVERPQAGGLLVRFAWDPAGSRAAADAARLEYQAVQRVLFAPARGRTWVLEVAWPGGEPEPPEVAALLASFALVEGGPR